jgi:hypothetical protein
MSRERFFRLAFLLHFFAGSAWAQEGHPQAPSPPPNAKTVKCKGRPVPQFEDITAKTGIVFQHTADPSKKYIVESMSGGVILLDYDRDGWVDIYIITITTAPSPTSPPKRGYRRRVLPWEARWEITTTMAGPICM